MPQCFSSHNVSLHLCLFSLRFSSLSFVLSCLLSLSLSVSLCLCLRVLCCCVVWCVARLGTQKKPSVCRFKTSPCVPAPRPHVVRVMLCNLFVVNSNSQFWTFSRPPPDQNFALFSLSRHNFQNYSFSWEVFSWNCEGGSRPNSTQSASLGS